MIRWRSTPGLYLPSMGFVMAALLVLSACAPELSRDELLTRAQSALDVGDLKAAELDIKSVLQETPEDAVARRLYGRIYLQRMDAPTATEQFDRSLEARADQSTRLWLAKSLPMAGESARLVEEWETGRFVTIENNPEFQASLARAMLAEADPERARAAIDRALAATPDPIGYVEVTAAIIALQLDGDTFGAEDRLKAVVERDGANAQALSVLGLIATQARDFEAAADYFERATKANPYRLGDQLQLIETQIRLGIADEADSNLARLERQLPKNPTVNMLRGQLLFDSGNYQDAVDLFNQILSVNPNQVGALLLSANANLRLGKLAAAQRQFEDYLALRPGDRRIRLQLAQVYALSQQSIKSESMARSVLDVAPDDQTALRLLAGALSAQGRHAESAQVLSELAELQPDSTETRIALGSQQLVAGDAEAGLAELEKAVAGAPDSAAARERLIEARLAVQDSAGAMAAAEAYVESFPDDARAALFLGRVKLQAGDRDSARRFSSAHSNWSLAAFQPTGPRGTGCTGRRPRRGPGPVRTIPGGQSRRPAGQYQPGRNAGATQGYSRYGAGTQRRGGGEPHGSGGPLTARSSESVEGRRRQGHRVAAARAGDCR